MKLTLSALTTLCSFLILSLLFDKAALGWKLQLCLNGSLEETTSEKCKYGFWFNEPKVIHKICFERGVWAVFKEFCDAMPVIWSVLPGTRGCMTHNMLGRRVAGVVPLGHDEYGAIAATQGRRLFFNNHKLKHGMKLDFLEPNPEIEILTWGSPSVTFSLQLVHSENKITRLCLEKGRQAFFAYYKIPLESNQNVSFYLGKNLCLDQKLENEVRHRVYPFEIDFDILTSSSEYTQFNCTKFAGIDDQFEEGAWGTNKESSDVPREKVRWVERRVDEETQKVVLKLVHYHFSFPYMNMIEKKHNFEEWQFLNVAKDLFINSCPKSMVPAFFVKQIHLLFLGVLYESFKSFPTRKKEDRDADKRILGALKECVKKKDKLVFKDAEICKKNESPLLIREAMNGTKMAFFVDMPPFIKVDIVNFDLIMEGIWKLMNFAHYYCADIFSEFSTDHSLLEGHWYSLFSPAIIRRWKYPGKSYRFMQQVFMSIDLERTIKNLDYCVSASRLHSVYKGWLKRPVTHWDKQRQMDALKERKLMWKEQAHCLDDYMYPARKMGLPIEKCGIRMPQVPLRQIDSFGPQSIL